MNESTALDGLKYALSITAMLRVRKSTPDYLAALDNVDVHIRAAIERVEKGDPIYSTAQAQ
jgi:hypothetical protein